MFRMVGGGEFRFAARALVALSVGLLLSASLLAQDSVQAGYGTMTPAAGNTVPVASILFSYTNRKGVLVSQAAVQAARPILSGVVFVDQSDDPAGRARSATASPADTFFRALASPWLPFF
jgi:hypothetical protein